MTDTIFSFFSVFLNVEVYGASYPDGVMEELRDLVMEIRPDIEKAKSGKL